MVRPVLDYASTVWDPHQKGDIKILEQVQRRAARYVYNDCTTRTPGCVTAMVKDIGWTVHCQTESPMQAAAWISGCGHLTTRGQPYKGQRGLFPGENKQRDLLQLVLPSYHPGMEQSARRRHCRYFRGKFRASLNCRLASPDPCHRTS